MKTIIFTLLLFAVTCVSASAQNKCGQTVELKYSNFTFCIPTGWKQLPREPQETYDNFGGPNPGEVLGVTSNYGDSVLKKVVDRAVNDALGSKDPAITNVTVASRNPFTTDSRVESEKVVFSAAIAGREYLIIQYIFMTGVTAHAEFRWAIPASAPASLISQIDASMANFRLKAR